jgi:hypothetical protein
LDRNYETSGEEEKGKSVSETRQPPVQIRTRAGLGEDLDEKVNRCNAANLVT